MYLKILCFLSNGLESSGGQHEFDINKKLLLKLLRRRKGKTEERMETDRKHTVFEIPDVLGNLQILKLIHSV